MRIKIDYLKWLNNEPAITEFEGTIEELKELRRNKFLWIWDEEDFI